MTKIQEELNRSKRQDYLNIKCLLESVKPIKNKAIFQPSHHGEVITITPKFE